VGDATVTSVERGQETTGMEANEQVAGSAQLAGGLFWWFGWREEAPEWLCWDRLSSSRVSKRCPTQ